MIDTRQILHSYPEINPLPVIASFSAKGGVKPIYVQIHGKRIQVSVRKIEKGGLCRTFECDYMIEEDNRVHTIELMFIPDLDIWGTPKKSTIQPL